MRDLDNKVDEDMNVLTNDEGTPDDGDAREEERRLAEARAKVEEIDQIVYRDDSYVRVAPEDLKPVEPVEHKEPVVSKKESIEIENEAKNEAAELAAHYKNEAQTEILAAEESAVRESQKEHEESAIDISATQEAAEGSFTGEVPEELRKFMEEERRSAEDPGVGSEEPVQEDTEEQPKNGIENTGFQKINDEEDFEIRLIEDELSGSDNPAADEEPDNAEESAAEDAPAEESSPEQFEPEEAETGPVEVAGKEVPEAETLEDASKPSETEAAKAEAAENAGAASDTIETEAAMAEGPVEPSETNESETQSAEPLEPEEPATEESEEPGEAEEPEAGEELPANDAEAPEENAAPQESEETAGGETPAETGGVTDETKVFSRNAAGETVEASGTADAASDVTDGSIDQDPILKDLPTAEETKEHAPDAAEVAIREVWEDQDIDDASKKLQTIPAAQNESKDAILEIKKNLTEGGATGKERSGAETTSENAETGVLTDAVDGNAEPDGAAAAADENPSTPEATPEAAAGTAAADADGAGSEGTGIPPAGPAQPAEQPSAPKRSKKKWIVLLIIALIAAGLVAVFYVSVVNANTFLPKSSINGVDVSRLTKKEAIEKITGEWAGHSITVTQNGETVGTISSLDLQYDLDAQIEKQLHPGWKESFLRLIDSKNRKEHITLNATGATTKFTNDVANLSIVKDHEVTKKSTDAYVDLSTADFKVVKETYGDELDTEKLTKAILTAVERGETTFAYNEKDFIKAPAIFSDDPTIRKQLRYAKKYLSQKITYNAYLSTYVIPPSELNKMIKGENGEITVDENAVKTFVDDTLEPKVETVGVTRTLKSVSGSTYTVSGGSYGLTLNKDEETAQLTQDLKSRKDVSRAPTYEKMPSDTSNGDIGNTYVEISLSSQHLWAVVKGQVVVSTDIVSGNTLSGHSTRTGTFSIVYCARNATLKGRNSDGTEYESHVSYWMPFDYGNGMHDATWRSSFGGSIYRYGGSHGCINMPYYAAQSLFRYAYAGMPVIVHW